MVETKQNTGMWSSRLGGLLAMCVPASFLCVFSVLPHFLLWTCNAWGFKKKEKNKRYEKSNKNDFTWVCANHPGLPGSCHNLLKVGLGHVLPPWRGEPAKTGWLHSQGYHTQVFHSTCATRPKAEHIFFFSIIVSVQLTNPIIFYQMEKKKFFSTCSKFTLCHLTPFFKPGRTCSNSLEKPLRAVDSNVKINEPHGGIISARKNRLGQSQSTHVLCFLLSKERKRREKKGREKERREEGKKGGESVCGVGEKWIKKITKWIVLTLRT